MNAQELIEEAASRQLGKTIVRENGQWTVDILGFHQWRSIPIRYNEKLKKLGNWDGIKLDTDHIFGFFMIALISFMMSLLVAMMAALVSESLLTPFLWAGGALSLLSPFLLVIGATCLDYHNERKQAKDGCFALYDLHQRRPHSTGAQTGAYPTFAVNVDADTRTYQLMQYNADGKKLQTSCLLSVPAPDDIVLMAELGQEMAHLAAGLERRARDKYQNALDARKAEEQTQQEVERLRGGDAEIMRQATGY
jgi:hypothetical protein